MTTKPESKRKRIGSLLHRSDASSSDSISIAASDAGVEDGSPKPKRVRPGAVLRTLSALSVKRHAGSSSSESLAIDTHAPTPPAEVSSEHKLLSPVAESPAVEQGYQGLSLPVLAESLPVNVSQEPPPVTTTSSTVPNTAPQAADAATSPAEPEVVAEVSEEPLPVEQDAPVAVVQLYLPPGLEAEPHPRSDSNLAGSTDVAGADVLHVADTSGDVDVEASNPIYVAEPPSPEAPVAPASRVDPTTSGSLDVVGTGDPALAVESSVFDAPAVPPVSNGDGFIASEGIVAAADVPAEDVGEPALSDASAASVVVQPIPSDTDVTHGDGVDSSVEDSAQATLLDDAPAHAHAHAAHDPEPSQTHEKASSIMGFEQFGWLIHHLPGESTPYFTLHGHDVVTDLDLRRDGAILSVYERLSCLDMPPPEGWELWLLDTVGGFVPAPDHYLVNHDLRVVSSTPVSSKPTPAERKSPSPFDVQAHADPRIGERYWEFVERHPVHCARIISSEEIVAGTNDALTWEFVKWPAPPGSGSDSDSDDPLFNEDESEEFSRSLSLPEGACLPLHTLPYAYSAQFWPIHPLRIWLSWRRTSPRSSFVSVRTSVRLLTHY